MTRAAAPVVDNMRLLLVDFSFLGSLRLWLAGLLDVRWRRKANCIVVVRRRARRWRRGQCSLSLRRGSDARTCRGAPGQMSREHVKRANPRAGRVVYDSRNAAVVVGRVSG